MLNRAARYFPIVRYLRSRLAPDAKVLEIGSGSFGIGQFWQRRFVGCDIEFVSRPAKLMLPVQCSATKLPFGDQAFDAVVVSDVMEHVAPEFRLVVASEALRVAKSIVVLGYPCGDSAFELDVGLFNEYGRKQKTPPKWLSEHMQHPFPNADLLTSVGSEWVVESQPNESLSFHNWMMRTEMNRVCDYAFRLALLVSPQLVASFLRSFDRPPAYRTIFFVDRQLNITPKVPNDGVPDHSYPHV